ncbi:MAG: hypothetical protein E6Q97_25650 [Desulfurellales bacterium]|nr:MAG: hypothetical protein E6Q97_25650 [Desulfurellales bacterium]
MANAYYAEVIFRNQRGDLDVPGVAREHTDGEWIEISPVGQQIVTGISLSAFDICNIVEIAEKVFTIEHIAELEKILTRVKSDLALT